MVVYDRLQTILLLTGDEVRSFLDINCFAVFTVVRHILESFSFHMRLNDELSYFHSNHFIQHHVSLPRCCHELCTIQGAHAFISEKNIFKTFF